MSFEDWLAAGDVPEVDWSDRLYKLMARGDLGQIGRGEARWLVDLPALTQPFACRSKTCTPGLRAPRRISCCADLVVELSEAERDAIAAGMPEVAAHLATTDPRWADGVPAWTDGLELTRPGGRCVFAETGRAGLRCGLHRVEDATGRPRGTLKPTPCRLFPLVVIDLGDGQRLLTAVHPQTARRLGFASAKVFPCLRDEPAMPLYRSCRSTIVELFGRGTYRSLSARVRRWRAAAEPVG
ncbi:MAG: hypothetical protein ABMB14_26355 [Myxococcota bacterium]